ncbi:MAG: histidinol-phosphate transaminase [Pseudomonadales bacterium]
MPKAFDPASLALPGILELSPYQPGKPVEELERELGIENSIKLASNENPRGPGGLVREAIARASEHLSRYPDGSGYALKQRLAPHLGVRPENITLGNGSNDVLELVARVFLGPGTSAVVSQFAFVVYRLAVTAVGAELLEVPAKDWGHDLDAMRAALREDTRVVFIANPNNPTGTWVTREALLGFLDALPSHVVLVLDEAYFEYVEREDYPDGIALLERHPNLVVTRTFSKIHGLASLRVGYSISSAQIADLMNRVRQPFNVSSLGQAAAVAALDDTDYVKTSRELNRRGLREIEAGLARLGLEYIDSLGNFVTFRCPGEGAGLYELLLREGVIVRAIANYSMPHHLRVTVGTPQENERFLLALEAALEKVE